MQRFLGLSLSRAALAALIVAWLSFGVTIRADETPPPVDKSAMAVEKATAKPAVDTAAKPDSEHPKQPAAEPAKQPATQPVKEPAAEPVKDSSADSAKQPAAGMTKEPAAETAKQPETVPAAASKLRFQFRFQPWKDVLDWFARQSDLSLVMDAPPQGTFNYSDTREYTPAEAIDLLNSVLLTKGYTLVRRNRMLMLINLEDGIPANLVSTVPLESLDSKGEFELVSVLFNLQKLKPEEAEVEIRKLLGPQGSVASLPKSRQVLVTDTAGRLRSARNMLARIEGPEGTTSGVRSFELSFARTEDVLPILRQMLDVPEDKSAAADGSVRIALETGSARLLVSGRPEKVARAAEIIKALDVPPPGMEGVGRVGGAAQIEVYPITAADPQSVLSVLQTLLVGQADVRLVIDPKSNNLIAMARPAQHATIRATLAQLQREGQRVEVIRLNRVDPQTAVLSIGKLFPAGDAKGMAPQVDADPATRQLMIRGTELQITQIRGLLEKMGEILTAGGESTHGGHVRTLPLTGTAARSALDQIQEIWPTLRPNKIRVMSPATPVPADQPGSGKESGGISPEMLNRLRELKSSGELPPKTSPADKPIAPKPASIEPSQFSPVDERSAELPGGARLVYVAEQLAASTPAEPNRAAPIVVTPGPNGLIIASEDTEALDEFERLMDMLGTGSANGRGVNVFYLKHAKAAAVTETLLQVFGGGATSLGGGTTSFGGGAMGAPAGAIGPGGNADAQGGRFRRAQASGDNALDSSGAASMMARLGASRGVLATGPIKIAFDQRLNALLVQANPTDLDSIDQLLKVLDQKESPEDVSVAPKPRMIAMQNTQAQEIADIVRQVYADRMIQAPATPGPQQAFAQMMMMQAQGGRQGGRGGGQARPSDDIARMSIGIDTRTNSLIVAAPDQLFEEVKQLVEQLDVAAGDQSEAVRVVTLHRTSPTAVEQALMAIAGPSVQINRTGQAPGQMGAGQPSPFGRQQQPSFQRNQFGGFGGFGQQRGGFNPGMQQQDNAAGRRGGGGRGQSQQPGGRQN